MEPAPGCPTDPPDSVVSDKLVNSCRPWLGASANKYPQVAKGLRAQTEYHEQRVSRHLDIVHAYNAVNTTGLTADEKYFALRPNTILFLNWKPVDVWSKADGSNATVNANIDANAASIKALGDTKIFLTLNHEPENEVSGAVAGCSVNGPGTAGSPADYRAMWRNIRERFDALGVTNVVWAMVYMSQPSFACMMDDLYPGNDLVDWSTSTTTAPALPRASSRTSVGCMTCCGSTAMHRMTSCRSHGESPSGTSTRVVFTPQQTYDYYDEAKAELESNRFPRLKAYLVYDSNINGANRILYNDKGVLDPLRQQHYAAFAQSPVFTATSPPSTETVAPSAPVIQSVTANGSGATVTWLPSTDDVQVSDYEIFRDGQFVGSERDLSFVDRGVALGGTYSYTVRAIDCSENASEFSDPAEVTVTDVAPPTVPVVSAVVNGDNSVTVKLTWTISTDNVGVKGYSVFRGTTLVTTLAGAAVKTYTVKSLTSAATYTFTVQSSDAAGNQSAPSNSATIKVR